VFLLEVIALLGRYAALAGS